MIVAAVLVGAGAAWFLAAEQQSDPAPAAEPATATQEQGTSTSDGGTGTAAGSDGPAAADTGSACSGMLGGQLADGDYVVLWESSDQVLFQDSYTLAEACRIAKDRFGDSVRIVDTTDYWDLNLDLKRLGIWAVYSGPYSSKSAAIQACAASQPCNVRLIQPCSRNDGLACTG